MNSAKYGKGEKLVLPAAAAAAAAAAAPLPAPPAAAAAAATAAAPLPSAAAAAAAAAAAPLAPAVQYNNGLQRWAFCERRMQNSCLTPHQEILVALSINSSPCTSDSRRKEHSKADVLTVAHLAGCCSGGCGCSRAIASCSRCCCRGGCGSTIACTQEILV